MLSHLHLPNHLMFWWPFLAWLVIITVLVSGCTFAAEPARVYRVGIVAGLEVFGITVEGFKAGMTDLGYIEGENIIYDVELSNFDRATHQPLLEQFVADEVDLIVTVTTEASLAAKAATEGTDVPVVFAIASTEDTGLVESVRHPGGNITGVRLHSPDLALKRLEVLLELLPEARRVWIPYQPDYPTVPSMLELLSPVAEAAGVTLLEAPVYTAAELEADLQDRATAADPGIDAILMLPAPLIGEDDAADVIRKFAEQHRVPIGGMLSSDEYGGLFDVSVDYVAAGQQAAFLADKVLHSTPAGSIPVLSVESRIHIDYRMAEELGLTIPEGLLRQADEIIR